MKTFQQSPSLKKAFQKQIERKISTDQELIRDKLGKGLGILGIGADKLNQYKNQAKGYIGENIVSLFVKSFPDTWTMFNNAVIPTSSGNLTEIDLIIIGHGGIFLIEVKTWKGSFSAYRDNWKRREGNKWICLPNSPTSQSAYHQKMFGQWVKTKIPDLPENCTIAPVVFPIAKWVGTTDCSVPVLTGVDNLLKMLVNSHNCLTYEQILKITEAIEDYEIPVSTISNVKSKPILKKNPYCEKEVERSLLLNDTK